MHLYGLNDPCKFIDFSGSTYQIQLEDPDNNEEIWTFLQLDAQGKLVDSFCDREETEGIGICSHIKLAFQRIYNGHDLPLHKRFESSLWNCLCRLSEERLGDDPKLLKKRASGDYAYLSLSGKAIFRVKGKSRSVRSHLKDILEHRQIDTEESSLKFSNLAQEELILWREGKPSSALKYELSYWSDLAKWMMLLEDIGETYRIDFGYGSDSLPNRIGVIFEDLEITFYVPAANLSRVIPALASIECQLKIYNAPEDEIKTIVYDKTRGMMSIVPRNEGVFSHPQKDVRGIDLEGWLFVPGDGFYARDPHHLLKKQTIEGHELAQLLNDHSILIKKLLSNAALHEDPVQLEYSLAFDTSWNLHIVPYILSPGDLTAEGSRLFDDWAYLDDDGFYRLEKSQFHAQETVVLEKNVPDFISQNRIWLNMQEGFRVHIASIESHLAFHLNHDDRLSFTREIDVAASGEGAKEFGSWIYIAGEGFYSKERSMTGLAQMSNLSINKEQISLFIRANHDELAFVTGFFSSKSPVKGVKIKISLESSDQLEVTPQYDILEEYDHAHVKFFDDFSYVEGEGFHELPPDLRLPERYRYPLHLAGKDAELFLTYELDELEPFIAKIDPRLIKPSFLKLIAMPGGADSIGPAYLLKFKYQSNLGAISVTSLWSSLHATKRRYLFSDAGLLDLTDKRFNWLRWLPKEQVDKRNRTIRLSTIELIRLHAMEGLEIHQKSRKSSSAQLFLDELLEFRTPEEPNLYGLQSQLRPYQMIGLKWLWFLYAHGLSGLLCDDMGLGKTHQTMALISAIQNSEGRASHQPFLVVCPTSVIYHWQEKLQEFLPELRVYTFYGLERSLEDFERNYDLLLTSYGIYRAESSPLSRILFRLAIFDEIQIAKNHNSRIYATLLTVKAKMRLGLTGTPIENHLRELKSLFDIVLPLYMPVEVDYKELFVKPIEKEGNKERQKLLSRMIKPFVMRRKKGDVVLDLPEKTEEISHCDLSLEQAKLYNEVLLAQRERLIRDLENERSPVPYIHIFALLSALKQICNHPAVFLKCPQNYRQHTSGKWALFLELLSEARESQQKIVVFSQYLGMLDIIQEYLNENGIAFASIRGATVNRGEQLKRFATDPTCEVFVASLQAAGLGVDLTAASVVFHYDRWWNAAREDQATDRVHRIGQMRGVQVFKLVTKDTFEESIDKMIRRKRRLMDETVSVDEQDVIKQFTREELMLFLKETHIKSSAQFLEKDSDLGL